MTRLRSSMLRMDASITTRDSAGCDVRRTRFGTVRSTGTVLVPGTVLTVRSTPRRTTYEVLLIRTVPGPGTTS